MICKKCFRLSDDGLDFCPYCGAPLTEAAEGKEPSKADANEQETEEIKNDREEINNPWDSPADTYFYREPPRSESARVPQSPIARLFSSMMHAICYFLLFLTLQSVISTGFQMYAMMTASADYVSSYFESNNIDVGSLSDEEYTSLITKLSVEMQDSLIEAAYSVDANAISSVSSVLTVLALFIIAKQRHRTFREHVNLDPTPLKNPRIWAAVPAAIAMQSIVIFILNVIPFSEETLESYNALYAFIGESPLWLEILSVVILAPIVEELIFRGCIHSRLRGAMKPLTAALISAFIFGIAHGHIISATYAFILGLILSYLYEKYQSIVVCVIFHMSFNAANYLPIITDETSATEFIVIVAVSVLMFAVCAALIITGEPKKTKENDSKGI